MKENCECSCCKHTINEYFCIKCKYNFNKCESYHNYEGISLCPKCHPENDPFLKKYIPTESDERNHEKYNLFRKYLKD